MDKHSCCSRACDPAKPRAALAKMPAVNIPQTTSSLSLSDMLGAMLARLTFNRMDYKIMPGVYALGKPTSTSSVFVSANYKLSFDTLRSSLKDIDAWILVLDTKGINVWCAAGKGTFGTKEMVERIDRTGLKDIVSHRTLIVPQLGAPGVAAHEVRSRTGFAVKYGPVRAADIPSFMKAGMRATPEMRRVRFPLADRLVLIPAEIAITARSVVFIAAAIFLLSGFGTSGYSTHKMLTQGGIAAFDLLSGCIAGAVIGPLLLPWLPGKSFSVKGMTAGIGIFIFSLAAGLIEKNTFNVIAWLFLMPAIASFLTMNFTGASTYTSLSGVKKEMRAAVPLQAIAGITGIVFWIIGRLTT